MSAGRTEVVVALSGGVDSAVSALLLRNAGVSARALFMKNWEEDDGDGYCGAAQDLADAERVCSTLDLRLHTVNFASEYWDRVFTRFVREYEAGRTPNPDVWCNKEIKFHEFLEYARQLGSERIATGHYARIVGREGRYRLLKARDRNKDQSYFLYMLGQEELGRCLFPLGDLEKSEVRRLAREAGLANHAKRDSTGICFIGERPFREFLAGYVGGRPGPIETPDGEVVGTHAGVAYYTVGQRRGLGLGGRRGGNGGAWYVAAKEPARNALVVVQGRAHPALYARSLTATELHWISGHAPDLPLACHAKIRYRQPDQACAVRPAGAGAVTVVFDAPQWAVAPGQSVVFYAGEECLGGGIIEAAGHR